MLGFPTSMAFERVATAACGAKVPLRKYSGTTSFAFVEATNRGRDDLIAPRRRPRPAAGVRPAHAPRPERTQPVRDAGPKGNDGSTDKTNDEPIIFD